jgi:cold shock protein
MEGTIKFFNETKGFGFIKPLTAGDQDVFVHFSGLVDENYKPQENDVVSYEVAQGRKGLQAEKVTFISSGNQAEAA